MGLNDLYLLKRLKEIIFRIPLLYLYCLKASDFPLTFPVSPWEVTSSRQTSCTGHSRMTVGPVNCVCLPSFPDDRSTDEPNWECNSLTLLFLRDILNYLWWIIFSAVLPTLPLDFRYFLLPWLLILSRSIVLTSPFRFHNWYFILMLAISLFLNSNLWLFLHWVWLQTV